MAGVAGVVAPALRSPPAAKRPAALAALPRGVWGHAPQKNFGNMDALRYSLVHSGVETESLLD